MRLDEWLFKNKRSQRFVAREIDSNPTSVSQWVRGIYPPSLENAQKIYKLTGGEVGLMDWPPPTNIGDEDMTSRAA